MPGNLHNGSGNPLSGQSNGVLMTQTTPSVGRNAEQSQDRPLLSKQEASSRSPKTSSEGQARLRKACDSCSIRKVKCDESGPPCRSCAALDIPCTFERPSRRRGPPNRHAEAVKRQRVQSPWEQVAPSSPPTVSTQGVRAPSSSDHVSAESICDIPTLQLLLDDYFIYIHPLVPVPHEPTFRAAFARREDLRDRTFLALVASMVGAFVASFPRIPLRRFKRVQNGQQLFSSSRTFLDRCHEITITARGLGYMDKSFTIYDAAISYLVGLIRAYTYDMKRCRVYFGECIMILRMLEVHKTNPTELAEYQRNVPKHLIQEDNVDSPGKVNYILRELGRRLFYLCVAGYGTIQQLGSTDGGVVMPPSTTTEPYPPLPVEVDDVYIFPSYIAPQPQGVISKLTGFNANVRVFCSYQSLSALEVAFGVDEHFGWERLKRVIGQCLRNVKAALDGVPPELVLQHVPPSKGNQNSQTQPQLNRHAEHWPSTDTASGHFSNDASNSNSALQYEIQKANIYASQLGTRSYLVEKYFNLCDVYGRHSSSPTSPDSISTPGFQAGGVDRDYLWSYPGQLPEVSCEAMAVERENIVKDLLVLLRTVDRVNMEPNGTSFTNKIRQIASTLLSVPQIRMGQLATRVETYLATFLDILMKLERLEPGESADDGVVMTEEEMEERELSHWASLKDCQIKFAEAGGFIRDL